MTELDSEDLYFYIINALRSSVVISKHYLHQLVSTETQSLTVLFHLVIISSKLSVVFVNFHSRRMYNYLFLLIFVRCVQNYRTFQNKVLFKKESFFTSKLFVKIKISWH